MGNITDQLYHTTRRVMGEWGLQSRACLLVLYGMAAEALPYQEALEAAADFLGEAKERLHAALCYDLLRAGYEVSPAELLEGLVWEVEA